MNFDVEESNNTGLTVSPYVSDNIYPLLPLLSEEFPNWTIKKIKNYVNLVITKKDNVSGMLVAKNASQYNVGFLIYTFQSVSSKYLYNNSKEEFSAGLVVENLVASSPILKQQIYLTLVEFAMSIGKKNNCKFIELPKLDETYKLINVKYNSQIIKINDFRTAIDLF